MHHLAYIFIADLFIWRRRSPCNQSAITAWLFGQHIRLQSHLMVSYFLFLLANALSLTVNMSSTSSSSSRPARKRIPSRRVGRGESPTPALNSVETNVEQTIVETSMPPNVVTPSKATDKSKHPSGSLDGATASESKKKKPKTLPSLASIDFENDDGINDAYAILFANSKKSRPESRRELVANILDKYSAQDVKAFYSYLCPHENKPGSKSNAVNLLVQFICNTYYALKGPVDSKTSPTDRYVICTFVYFKHSD